MSKWFLWIRLWTLILQKRFFDLILPCFKIGLSQICFSKIGLRAWVTDFFGSNCEHLFSKKMIFPCFKNRLSQFGYFEIWIEAMSKWFVWIKLWTSYSSKTFFWFDFPCFKIGLSQICFSKIGLRAWVTDFFGSNCEHLFSKKMIFPCFKNRLSQFGYFEIWIEAMSKWFVWIKLWTSYSSKTFFWFDFPCFKIGLSQICFSKIGLKPWKMFFWIKLWTLFNNVFLIGCSVLQNWIISNLICPKLDCGHE